MDMPNCEVTRIFFRLIPFFSSDVNFCFNATTGLKDEIIKEGYKPDKNPVSSVTEIIINTNCHDEKHLSLHFYQ